MNIYEEKCNENKIVTLITVVLWNCVDCVDFFLLGDGPSSLLRNKHFSTCFSMISDGNCLLQTGQETSIFECCNYCSQQNTRPFIKYSHVLMPQNFSIFFLIN